MAWLDLLFFLSCFHLVVPSHVPRKRRELKRTNPSNSSKTKATTNKAFIPLRSCMLLLVCFGVGCREENRTKLLRGCRCCYSRDTNVHNAAAAAAAAAALRAPRPRIQKSFCFVCVRVCNVRCATLILYRLKFSSVPFYPLSRARLSTIYSSGPRRWPLWETPFPLPPPGPTTTQPHPLPPSSKMKTTHCVSCFNQWIHWALFVVCGRPRWVPQGR